MKILIAEDDAISALVLRRALENLGHDVWLEPNGARAWELLRGQQFRLVMTDWMMPHLTGVELCRNIREREGRPYIYIILLTVKSSPEDRALAMAAGIDDFLVKPADPSDLVARIEVAERMLALKDQVAMGMGAFPSAGGSTSKAPELGSILVSNGVITVGQLDVALAEQLDSGLRIGEILCAHGWAGEEDVARAYAQQVGIAYVSVRDRVSSPAATMLIPHAVSQRCRALPMDFNAEGKLRVAMENPFDFEAITLIERLANCSIDVEIAAPMALTTTIADAYERTISDRRWELSIGVAA